jgi:hypothetical protein
VVVVVELIQLLVLVEEVDLVVVEQHMNLLVVLVVQQQDQLHFLELLEQPHRQVGGVMLEEQAVLNLIILPAVAVEQVVLVVVELHLPLEEQVVLEFNYLLHLGILIRQ